MTLAERLSEHVRACFTGLWVQSHEHDDALIEMAALCRQENWRLAVWDIDRGLRIPGNDTGPLAAEWRRSLGRNPRLVDAGRARGDHAAWCW